MVGFYALPRKFSFWSLVEAKTSKTAQLAYHKFTSLYRPSTQIIHEQGGFPRASCPKPVPATATQEFWFFFPDWGTFLARHFFRNFTPPAPPCAPMTQIPTATARWKSQKYIFFCWIEKSNNNKRNYVICAF